MSAATVDIAQSRASCARDRRRCRLHIPPYGPAEGRDKGKKRSMAGRNREWASLTCASDRFDIDCGRARCHCTTADFAAVTDADVVVVVPAACRRASSMIAYAAVPAGRGGGRCSVEVAVSRASARCARPYRFAYVDGRRYGVMAVSAPFAFDHRGGPCDCDTSPGGGGGGGAADAGVADGRDSRAGETAFGAPDRLASATVRGMSAFVSSLMDTRFGAPRCPACNVPANHGQVLEHLRTSADRLRRGTADVKKECSRYFPATNKRYAPCRRH